MKLPLLSLASRAASANKKGRHPSERMAARPSFSSGLKPNPFYYLFPAISHTVEKASRES
jgi:hypothetical protein